MKIYKIYQLVLLLTPFVFSFAFGLDIYIPIVPDMAQIFETSPAMVQLTLSLFLLITGAGQLLIGPLSDQLGRKQSFCFSSFFYALGSLSCAFSTNIHWLILARSVSAFGACGMLVTAFALVRDLYSKDKSAQIYSYLNGSIGISPTFAPILGGYLAVSCGWHSIFYFLALIGAFSLALSVGVVEETLPLEKRIKINRTLFKRYFEVLSHPQFLVYSCLSGLAESVFFCFFSISPFIIIELLEVPTQEFGYYFAVFGSVIGLGGFASGKLIEKIGILPTLNIGVALLFAGGAGILIWYYVWSLSLAGFLLPMAIACTGAIFLVGCAASTALEPFGAMAGTASAAFGAVEFGISSLSGTFLMCFPATSTVPYGIAILIIGSMAFLLLVFANRIKKKTHIPPLSEFAEN